MNKYNKLREVIGHPVDGAAALYELIFPNGKRYFGISTDPWRRLRSHKSDAHRGSPHLVHRAMRRHGAAAVAMRVLVVGLPNYILALEQSAICRFQTTNPKHGYNLTPGGEINPMSIPSCREKMRLALTGRKDSEAVCQRKRASWTSERRAAMGALRKGKSLSVEHREKLRIASTGKKLSAESIRKIVEKNRGKRRPAEVVARIAEKLRGRRKTPEALARHLAALAQPKCRENMRRSSAERWARKFGPKVTEADALVPWRNPALSVQEALLKMPGWTRRSAYRRLGGRGTGPARFPIGTAALVKLEYSRGATVTSIIEHFKISRTHVWRLIKS